MYSMDWATMITPIAVGVISGIFGSLISPLINWKVERVRLRHQFRSQKIKEWQEQIERTKDFSKIQFTLTWQELKPYLSEKEQNEMSEMVVCWGESKVSGEDLKRRLLLKAVVRAQREWGLI